jgi:serine/threonine protein kinase
MSDGKIFEDKFMKKYGINIIIGKGGMAVVYRAHQPSMGRDVAIKVILKPIAGDASAVQRFQREARIIARLEHPHIVPLYDYWREPNIAFLVMRLLRGGSCKSCWKKGRCRRT